MFNKILYYKIVLVKQGNKLLLVTHSQGSKMKKSRNLSIQNIKINKKLIRGLLEWGCRKYQHSPIN